ncbi:hypothetical protein BDV38DRAFT_281445 [Aspergillus pseudotamarii]|uniref:Uncharacterized protein n=1 Tax=Aspergillus pseudotamarii TaxID=132259 RepID=A0A5N6SZL7_ASPPS|nr:uncharacterized protein BDV38DRAFT_281445 [Aspergillus pseudotamarii]KAE8138883.1 hypothetical protein BDV38DRAFT_281445 [Aspergillus pseudotamarii]
MDFTTLAPVLVGASLHNQATASRNVYMCPGPNWTDPCSLFSFNIGECLNIEFWDTLGSIGPDPDLVCYLWIESGNCVNTVGNIDSGGIVDPGIAGLQTWDDGETGKPAGYWFNEAKSNVPGP